MLVSSFRCAAAISIGILISVLAGQVSRAEEKKPVLKGTWRGILSQEAFVIPEFVISMEFTQKQNQKQKGEEVTGTLRSEVRGKPAQFAVMSFTGTLKGRVLTFRSQKFLKRTPLGAGRYWVLPSGKLTLSSDDATLQGPWTGNKGAARGTLIVRDVTRMALTLKDIERAARALGCEVPCIRALIDVETAGAGFLPSGLPRILFQDGKKYGSSPGDISASGSAKGRSPGLDKAGEGEYDRLVAAMRQDAVAALGATLWGRFQILGSNHKLCGYDKIEDFVRAMQESEGKQLDAFVAFLKSRGLDRPLREKRWQDFARGYKGNDFASQKYDEKLADAYKKHTKDTKEPKEPKEPKETEGN
jgi:hypothetical protein